jgi:hypothetical protein
MQFTKFLTLRKAIAALDANFIRRQVARLENALSNRGCEFSAENTVVTEEGIFYIDEGTGLTGKVAMYVGDFLIPLDVRLPSKKNLRASYDDKEMLDSFHQYHLLRCNVLSRAETNGWKEPFRVTQRSDGTFYYRLLAQKNFGAAPPELFQEIEAQKLYVCKNCLLKVNSLLEGIAEYEQESFEPKYFFDIDFSGSWCRYAPREGEEDEFLADINPSDWRTICDTRKAQVSYHCESCDVDLSRATYQKFLHIHRSSHSVKSSAYVRLECLCIACLSEKYQHEHVKEMPEYFEFLQEVGLRKPEDQAPAVEPSPDATTEPNEH